jgi:drug/metabolite transporter (DMT)-like permease
LNAGERLVDAGTAVMLVNAAPILIALFAGVFLREGLPARLIVGCLVAFAGTALVGAAAADGGAAGAPGRGVALCLVAVAAYAAAATLQKRALRRVPGAWVNLLGALAAAAACLPFAPALAAELGAAAPEERAWLVYLGLFPTGLGFTTWAYAAARMPVGRLAVTTYLIAPVTIALSWLLLAELPPWLAVAGGAICVAGVALARSRGRRRESRPPARYNDAGG